MGIVFCLVMITLMLIKPGITTGAARDALRVWGLDVAPSLFPYMVLCRLVASRLQKTGIPAAPAAAVLGLLGGSPSGAATLSGYAEGLNTQQVRLLAALTGTISPMFLLNAVKLWSGDPRLCRLLLASHLSGAIFALVCTVFLTHGQKKSACQGASVSSGNPITESVQSILSVGGCIVFFSVLAAGLRALLPRLGLLPGALLHAALEISGGLHSLCALQIAPGIRAVCMAAASGFSGLSILMQNHLFLRPLGLTFSELLFFALLRAFGAGVMMAFLF